MNNVKVFLLFYCNRYENKKQPYLKFIIYT